MKNFDIQRLNAQMNSAQNLASDVQKKARDHWKDMAGKWEG